MNENTVLDSIIAAGKFAQEYDVRDAVIQLGNIAQEIKAQNLTDPNVENQVATQISKILLDVKGKLPDAVASRYKTLVAIILEAIGGFALGEEAQTQAFKSITAKILSLL
jgi:hypothetical protein